MTDPHTTSRRQLFGLELDAMRLEDVVATCSRAIRARSTCLIGVLNAAKVVNLRSDVALRDSLLECDLLLADGQSVVWASKMLGTPLPERVPGIDVFEALLELADRDGHSVYLLGARPEVLSELVAVIGRRFPGARIAGARDGYFSDEEAASIADDIRRSGADMLFLGMVSPKKEIFLGTHGSGLGVPVLHGVGGSFDVLAGVTHRAPPTWQRFGMEWAYRLKQEPGRLWRRYARTNTKFVLQVVREGIRPTPVWVTTHQTSPALPRGVAPSPHFAPLTVTSPISEVATSVTLKEPLTPRTTAERTPAQLAAAALGTKQLTPTPSQRTSTALQQGETNG